MIAAQQLVDQVLAEAARLGGADETTVIVTDRADASLRWAGNSMTTNGETRGRSTTVHLGGAPRRAGARRLGEHPPRSIRTRWRRWSRRPRPPRASAPAASDNAPRAARRAGTRRLGCAGTEHRCADVFADVATSLVRGFRGADPLYGYARHILETTFVATSGGLRRRFTQPTGSVEINAKRNGASAWAGRRHTGFRAMCPPTLCSTSCRPGWAGRRARWSCPPDATRR